MSAQRLDAPHKVIIEQDIIYRKTENQSLALDLYISAGAAEPAPVVILVFGGGWQEGSKGQLSRYAIDFASNGFVAIEPNYRLSGVASFLHKFTISRQLLRGFEQTPIHIVSILIELLPLDTRQVRT